MTDPILRDMEARARDLGKPANVPDLSAAAVRERDLERRKDKARSFMLHMKRAFKGISPQSDARARAALRYAKIEEDEL